MHELPITESILKIVLKHAEMNHLRKIMAVHLRIGKLSDLEDEWIQRYFDYLSRDTIAAGAVLKIERSPVVIQCASCGENYEIEADRRLPGKMHETLCPSCGGKGGTIVSGREYYIKEMEAC